MDSDGDGFGDLKGIISKLDYFSKLGVNCIWLTPTYTSPQRDNGYDVEDYCSIDPRYGTMEDFVQLTKECNKRNIIIMLDMVFNHTSSEHIWFKKALAGDKEFKDYYIFKAQTENGGPPTNWISKFGGSAWERVEDEYYLHLFDVSQPDLNWENPKLRQEIYNIMNFWLDKGIKGFRFDVVNLISKPQIYENDYEGDGRRFYTDGHKVHHYLKELNSNTFGKYNCVTVGEMSSTTIENCIKYSNPNENELSMTFNFHHLKVDYLNGDKWSVMDFDFEQLKELLHTWQIEMQKANGWNAVFWCNHDQPRAVSRFGCDKKYRNESAKMLATVIHLMRGTPYIYQGEEIGMTNAYFENLDDYVDVESLNYIDILKKDNKNDKEILDILSKKSRDNARTPMQWNKSKNAGFSNGKPWLCVANNYEEINVDKALADYDSIFYHYQKLIKIRAEEEVISDGIYTPMLQKIPNIFSYMRELNGKKILVISNFYACEQKIDIKEFVSAFHEPDILITNYGRPLCEDNILSMRPYEALALYV